MRQLVQQLAVGLRSAPTRRYCDLPLTGQGDACEGGEAAAGHSRQPHGTGCMNKSGTAGNVIARPQGGGAIRGLGDTFSPDLHTGTGNLTVPIATPAGRNKLQPELSLVYSTGRGNGPFGLGWAVSIPGVTRDTRGGVPTYVDADDT